MATRWYNEENGVCAEFVAEGGKIHKRTFDPNREAKLRFNREIKRNGGTRKMEWGQMVADIPVSDLPVLRGLFGQALFNDKYPKEDRKIARVKFLQSPASDPYRVQERRRV